MDLLESSPDSPYYYTEDCHPPVFSVFKTVKLSKGKASMVPMLAFEESIEKKFGRTPSVIWDSSEILKEVCPFLYPTECTEEIEKLVQYIGRKLGATHRGFSYHSWLTEQNA